MIIRDKLEPQVRDQQKVTESTAMASAAISLKRIADALDYFIAQHKASEAERKRD